MTGLGRGPEAPGPVGEPLSTLFLPPVGRDFYSKSVRRLLPALGSHEHSTYDYHSAVHELNESTKLGLNGTELKALSLMLTGLAQSARFRNTPYLEPWLGENSAVHSIHCALLMIDQFDAAGLLAPEKQTTEIIDLRRKMTLGALVHDLGEIVGEFSSLSQRIADDALQEVPKIERRILEKTMRLAIWAAQESKPLEFYENISGLRDALKIGTEQQSSLEQIKRAVNLFDEVVVSGKTLSKRNETSLARLLALFDIIELQEEAALSDRDKFIANGVKLAEHMQGTRHFIRFSTKGPDFSPIREFSTPTQPSLRAEELPERMAQMGRSTIPVTLSPSYNTKRSAEYIECGLPDLLHSARSEAETALAKRLRDSCWETSIEYINLSGRVFDRQVSALPKRLMDNFSLVWSGRLSEEARLDALARAEAILRAEQRGLLARHNDMISAISTDRAAASLLPIESSERMMSLYRTAIERDYIPPLGSPPLILLKELPRELSPIRLVNWEERRQNRP